MVSYYVYRHINKVNGKQYIGLTKQLPNLRWGNNGVNYRGKCPHFWNAIQKYGWDNFAHEVISSNLSKEEACDLEKELICKYKTQDRRFGYNILEGGAAPEIPQEVRNKMSIAMRGNKNGLGHPCTDEKRRKISTSQKGRKLTKEHKEKLSKAKIGVPHRPPSAETRIKISNSHSKTSVYCRETDKIYPSIQGCARSLSLYATNVCKCCKGKIKSTGGYHIQYYKRDDNTINA